MGEICAAVLSVHEKGLAFNDLKPENVLITALGHIKVTLDNANRVLPRYNCTGYTAKYQVTDFGACRAVTAEGEALMQTGNDLIANLRDGDWRERTGEESTHDPDRYKKSVFCIRMM